MLAFRNSPFEWVTTGKEQEEAQKLKGLYNVTRMNWAACNAKPFEWVAAGKQAGKQLLINDRRLHLQ
jgi:hypothetical protein